MALARAHRTSTAERSTPERAPEALFGAVLGAGAGLFATELGLQSLLSYWDDSLAVVLFFALGTAGLAAALGPKRGRTAALSILIGLELLYAVVVLTPVARILSSDLVRDDGPLKKADAVFVFGSSIYRNGQLSSVALDRLVHGMGVLEQSWAPRLVLSELPGRREGYAKAATALMERFGQKHEVLAVGPVHRSRDEARLVAELFREKGWKRVIAVTSPLHSRRACAALEHEGLEVQCSPSAESQFDLTALRRSTDRLRAFSSAIHEHAGFWYYRLRGWI